MRDPEVTRSVPGPFYVDQLKAEVLVRWIERAVTAKSAADVFG